MDIHPVEPEKRAAIEQALARIEHEHDVRILFACESGSRGWGFSSPDSDYDARFVYVHRPSWYLSVNERTGPGEPQRDVIELPIETDLDVSGWDLRKALRLLSKSNPTLLEWMRSPIVYRRDEPLASSLEALAARTYSRRAGWHHYLSMASSTFDSHLQGERIRTKKYLYAIRPVLACLWIEADVEPPPMAFERLLDRLCPTGPLREAIDALLVMKRASKEVADAPRIPVISDFLAAQLAHMRSSAPDLPGREGGDAGLDAFLREALGVG